MVEAVSNLGELLLFLRSRQAEVENQQVDVLPASLQLPDLKDFNSSEITKDSPLSNRIIKPDRQISCEEIEDRFLETMTEAQTNLISREEGEAIRARFDGVIAKFTEVLDRNHENIMELLGVIKDRFDKQNAEQEGGQSSMSQPLLSVTQPVLSTTQPVLSAAQQVLTTAHPISQPFLSITQPVSSTAQQDLPTVQPLLPNQSQLQFHLQEIRPTCNKHQDSSPELWRADGPLFLCPEERYRPWPRTAIGPAALQCSEHLRVAEDPSQLPPPRGPERYDGEPAGNYAGITRLAKLEFPRFDGAQFQERIFKTEQFFKIDATANQGNVSANKAAGVKTLLADSNNVTSAAGITKGSNGLAPLKPTNQTTLNTSSNLYGMGVPRGGFDNGYQPDSRFCYDGYYAPVPWSDGSKYSDVQRHVSGSGIASSYAKSSTVPSSRNQNYHSNSHDTSIHQHASMTSYGTAQGYYNRMYSNKLYGQYDGTRKSGMGYGYSGYDSRTNGRGWVNTDNKYRSWGRGNSYFYGNEENVDGLNELNRGPRAKGTKNQKGNLEDRLQDLENKVLLNMGDLVYVKLQPYRKQSVVNRESQKLFPNYFGPYALLDRCGEVSYKLQLPSESRIHPVFHVSQLKLAVGNAQVSTQLPVMVDDVFERRPEQVLQRRKVQRHGKAATMVLIKWSDAPETEATWEYLYDIQQRFPAFEP